MKPEHTYEPELDGNFASIRHAIENQAYEDLDRLLAEQRTLISNLSFADPDARAYFMQAQDLTAWSLSLVKLRQSAISTAISDVSRQKLLQERYSVPSVAAIAGLHD
jgi:hypothetical protein